MPGRVQPTAPWQQPPPALSSWKAPLAFNIMNIICFSTCLDHCVDGVAVAVAVAVGWAATATAN